MDFLVKKIKFDFEKAQNPDIAEGQKAYMKNLFPFLGIKAPVRDEIVKKHLKAIPATLESALALWELEEREYQYASCMVLERYYKKATISQNDLSLIESLIQKKSWWDTVDWLAPKIAGLIFLKNLKLRSICDRWNESENMWLRRSSLICQLKWKEKTDHTRLFRYIDRLSHEKEFFIRKAIGWSLREYSKTNPKAVKNYVERQKETLSPLSYREAIKHLRKHPWRELA